MKKNEVTKIVIEIIIRLDHCKSFSAKLLIKLPVCEIKCEQESLTRDYYKRDLCLKFALTRIFSDL